MFGALLQAVSYTRELEQSIDMRNVYSLLAPLERDGAKVAPVQVVPIGTTEHVRDNNNSRVQTAAYVLSPLSPSLLRTVPRHEC